MENKQKFCRGPGGGFSKEPPGRQRQRLDRILAVVALTAIVIAWFVGSTRKDAELTPFLEQALPGAERLEPLEGGYYVAWKEGSKIGYMAVGTGHGYGGALTVVVAVSPGGTVQRFVLVDHKETGSFLKRVLKSGLLKSLAGKAHSDVFVLKRDVDGVSGATYTSRAFADAVRRGTRKIAKDVLRLPTPEEPVPEIQFGFIEVFLMVLFIAAYVGTRKWFKYKKTIRWIGLLGSFVVLGFVFGKPLTLIFINKMLLGYWPSWQVNLFWYILLVGTLFFILVTGKNFYCERVCPFGAAQECLGVIGGGKKELPKKARTVVRWFQRGLALAVILLALVYTNPSIYTYEVFGAFFRLIGSTFLFGLLAVVLISSLFMKRSWCNILCPVKPVLDYLRLIRNWVNDLFKRD